MCIVCVVQCATCIYTCNHMVLVWLRAVHVWLRKKILLSTHVRVIEANVCVSNVICFT